MTVLRNACLVFFSIEVLFNLILAARYHIVIFFERLVTIVVALALVSKLIEVSDLFVLFKVIVVFVIFIVEAIFAKNLIFRYV